MVCRRMWLTSVGLTMLFAAVMPVSVDALTEDVPWHDSLNAARSQSTVSGKPIMAIAYRQEDEASQTLIGVILRHPDVVAQLSSFELFAANVDDPAAAEFCKRYRVGVVSADDPWLVVYPILPIMLFLEANGKEHFRDYGTIPTRLGSGPEEDLSEVAAKGFAGRLETIIQLVALLRQVEEAPTAQAHSRAGHILMEMERFDEARPHLQKAMQLDPNNDTGAFAEAYFDAIILGLADDPERAVNQLDDYMARYTASERLLEARYYKGVCLVALERYREAATVLKSFETGDRRAPEFDSPWTPLALGLLKELQALNLAR